MKNLFREYERKHFKSNGLAGSYFIDNDGCVKYYDDGSTSYRITKMVTSRR